jgi:hypothetical protein
MQNGDVDHWGLQGEPLKKLEHLSKVLLGSNNPIGSNGRVECVGFHIQLVSSQTVSMHLEDFVS